jgi:hypothetical protein
MRADMPGQKGASAMQVLGPVVYALQQPGRLLRQTDIDASAWHDVRFTPRQLFLYLETAAFDSGKRGARLRSGGGRVCRWEHPDVVRAWRGLLEIHALVGNMRELLAIPLHEAQELVFAAQGKQMRKQVAALVERCAAP